MPDPIVVQTTTPVGDPVNPNDYPGDHVLYQVPNNKPELTITCEMKIEDRTKTPVEIKYAKPTSTDCTLTNGPDANVITLVVTDNQLVITLVPGAQVGQKQTINVLANYTLGNYSTSVVGSVTVEVMAAAKDPANTVVGIVFNFIKNQ